MYKLWSFLFITMVSLGILSFLEPTQPSPYQQAFAGRWIIDQPAHALYEATIYDFHVDGRLEVVGSVNFYGEEEYITGIVAHPDDPQLTCEFGNRWDSLDENILIIEGICTDETYREIVFVTNMMYMPSIQVDGEDGWYHPGFEWAWRKCIEPEDCMVWGEDFNP